MTSPTPPSPSKELVLYDRKLALIRQARQVALPVAVALLLGIIIGAAATPATSSEVYTELAEERDDLSNMVEDRDDRLVTARSEIRELNGQVRSWENREQELDDRQTELDELEADLDEREAEVTEAEERRAANTFGAGMQLVGEDIEPGTYRADGSGDNCYWERLSGTSGDFSDIITNHFGSARQVVTISGSDAAFSSRGCGQWTKQ